MQPFCVGLDISQSAWSSTTDAGLENVVAYAAFKASYSKL